jgi:hypothetical protein
LVCQAFCVFPIELELNTSTTVTGCLKQYLLVSGAVLIPVGFACFVLGERWAKRTGKLKIEG